MIGCFVIHGESYRLCGFWWIQISSEMMWLTTTGVTVVQVSVVFTERGYTDGVLSELGDEDEERIAKEDSDRLSPAVKQERLSPVDLDGDEAEVPEFSQLKGVNILGRARSTPSTLSEELEDRVLSEGEVAPAGHRPKGSNRKRGASKTVDLDTWEASEVDQDSKRIPRKSARLA